MHGHIKPLPHELEGSRAPPPTPVPARPAIQIDNAVSATQHPLGMGHKEYALLARTRAQDG